MEQGSGVPEQSSGEQFLFHGTSPNTVPKINSKSFNRSYCGKNATAYGKGVYFARNASYSANPTYSPADGVGIRCMYLARVLVGLSVIGSSSMVEPPQLPGGNGRTYDSTCDQEASIFVVYHDAQAYPEYLIEFQ